MFSKCYKIQPISIKEKRFKLGLELASKKVSINSAPSGQTFWRPLNIKMVWDKEYSCKMKWHTLKRVCEMKDACDTSGIKINSAKTEVLHLWKSPDQCSLQVNGAVLMQVDKFKYLGVAFTSDERQDEELDTRIGKANAITRALHYSDVIHETRIVEKRKVINFQNSFCSHSHRWSGILGNDQKRAIASASVLQSQVQEFTCQTSFTSQSK